jgi:hypothetical protein
MKYVVDIDGTVCSVTDGKYEEALPNQDRIAKINKLYDEENQIIYLTARGMGRSGDNADLAKRMFYELTKHQLDRWGCKYHKLVLGKPSGDYYIDDKGINSDEFFKN